MMRNATKGFEQTKVANEESASNMLGGTRMQRIIFSAMPNWQLSTVSQFLPRSSQISAITPQTKFSTHNSQFDIHSSQFSIHNSQQPILNS